MSISNPGKGGGRLKGLGLAAVSPRELVGVVIISAIIALSFGLSFGDEFSNHTTYLLSGMHLAKPEFLANDWYLTQATQYHVLFSRLVELLFLSGGLKAGLAVLNWLSMFGTIACTYAIVRLLAQPRSAFLAWCLASSVFFLGMYAFTVAGTYFFSPGFQPSVISTFCVVLGLLEFLRGNFWRSGIVLAIGGAFHFNYEIISVAAFGLAHLGLGRGRLFRRLIAQHGAMALVFVLNVPLILTMRAVGDDANTSPAFRIFANIAEPGHYDTPSYWLAFVPFALVVLFGWIVLHRLGPADAAWRRLKCFQAASLALIGVAILCDTLVVVPLVVRAFLFRLNPFVLMIAVIVLAVAAVRQLDERSPDAAPSARGTFFWIGAMMSVLVYFFFSWVLTNPRERGGWPLICPTLLLLYFAGVAVLVAIRRGRRPGSGLAWLPAHIGIAGLLTVAGTLGAARVEDFNLLTGEVPEHGAGLYKWARTTDPSASFVIPPGLTTFRLWSGRSAVVDTKSVPMNPSGVIEWYRRMGDVSGHPGFTSTRVALEGYGTMGWADLRRVACKYRSDYIVVDDRDQRWAGDVHAVYSDKWFVALGVGNCDIVTAGKGHG